jgi:hypothetical protein
LLYAEHGAFLRQLPADYRVRVVRAAVRVSTLLYGFSLSLNHPFKAENTLLGGMLSALFDDLFDRGWETPESILAMIEDPARAHSRSEMGEHFLRLYCLLRQRLGETLAEQLARHLRTLAECERDLVSGRGDGRHWWVRGTAATVVLLSVLGVPESYWSAEEMGVLGEYLQMLDDFEDIATDPPEVNYFVAHPGFDIDAFFQDCVLPSMRKLFVVGPGHAPGCDTELLTHFIESFHLFLLDNCPMAHPARHWGSGTPFYPWSCSRVPEPLRGWPLRWWWGSTVWFVTAWHRFLPRQIRVPLTFRLLRLFGWS